MIANAALIIVEGLISVAANYSPSVDDYIILATEDITITLPVPETSRGAHYIIKKTDAEGKTVTIATTGTVDMDGDSSLTLTQQYEGVEVVCDGTQWYKVGIMG